MAGQVPSKSSAKILKILLKNCEKPIYRNLNNRYNQSLAISLIYDQLPVEGTPSCPVLPDKTLILLSKAQYSVCVASCSGLTPALYLEAAMNSAKRKDEPINTSGWFVWPRGVEGRMGIVISIFRLLSFGVALIQIFILQANNYTLFSPVFLALIAGVFTLFMILWPASWQKKGNLSLTLLVVDVAVCAFLVISTNNIYSPYILFSLTPVVSAALLMDIRVTAVAAVITALYVGIGYANNLFNIPPNVQLGIGRYLIFLSALGMINVLPYLINVNYRQHLSNEEAMKERKKILNEIHDGCAQTVSALRWQSQLLSKRLSERGLCLAEMQELEKLAEKAQKEIREPLELMENYIGSGSFIPYLKEYTERLNRESQIDFIFDGDTNAVRLDPRDEIELLRICQEALANIYKHSGARLARVTLKPSRRRLEVNISDDGTGFDPLTDILAQSNANGLAVMQERAKSIHARFKIVTGPGKGTQISIHVPLDGKRWKQNGEQ
jgi:signal transduction histidine kinase